MPLLFGGADGCGAVLQFAQHRLLLLRNSAIGVCIDQRRFLRHQKYIGLNYGLLLLAWGLAGILGPYLGGRVFVLTHEYRWAFYAAAMLEVVALGALLIAKNPHRATDPAVKGSAAAVPA